MKLLFYSYICFVQNIFCQCNVYYLKMTMFLSKSFSAELFNLLFSNLHLFCLFVINTFRIFLVVIWILMNSWLDDLLSRWDLISTMNCEKLLAKRRSLQLERTFRTYREFELDTKCRLMDLRSVCNFFDLKGNVEKCRSDLSNKRLSKWEKFSK